MQQTSDLGYLRGLLAVLVNLLSIAISLGVGLPECKFENLICSFILQKSTNIIDACNGFLYYFRMHFYYRLILVECNSQFKVQEAVAVAGQSPL